MRHSMNAPRIIPPITPLNRHFWTGGRDGKLLILRRRDGRFLHPPECVSPEDGELDPVPVSGNATVFAFTVNAHPYNPAVPVPYVIAIVELDEQRDLRLPTNIVNCAPERVRIGMRVRVLFERHGDVFVPVFEPLAEE
jgi:uncharacterized OB-fold protein